MSTPMLHQLLERKFPEADMMYTLHHATLGGHHAVILMIHPNPNEHSPNYVPGWYGIAYHEDAGYNFIERFDATESPAVANAINCHMQEFLADKEDFPFMVYCDDSAILGITAIEQRLKKTMHEETFLYYQRVWKEFLLDLNLRSASEFKGYWRESNE